MRGAWGAAGSPLRASFERQGFRRASSKVSSRGDNPQRTFAFCLRHLVGRLGRKGQIQRDLRRSTFNLGHGRWDHTLDWVCDKCKLQVTRMTIKSGGTLSCGKLTSNVSVNPRSVL